MADQQDSPKLVTAIHQNSYISVGVVVILLGSVVTGSMIAGAFANRLENVEARVIERNKDAERLARIETNLESVRSELQFIRRVMSRSSSSDRTER